MEKTDQDMQVEIESIRKRKLRKKLELRDLATQIGTSEASFTDRMQEMEKNFSLKSRQKKWVLGRRNAKSRRI